MIHPALPDDALDVRHLRESAPAKWAALTRTERQAYDAGRTTGLLAARQILHGGGRAAFARVGELAQDVTLPALHAGQVTGEPERPFSRLRADDSVVAEPAAEREGLRPK